MIKCGLIDFSNPQWLERHFREYTINRIWDIVTKENIDFQTQAFYYYRSICEENLSKYFYADPTGELFKKIPTEFIKILKEKEKISDGYKCIYNEIHPNTIQRYAADWGKSLPEESITPLLELYLESNKIKEENGVRSLLSYFQIPFSEWLEGYHLPNSGLALSKENDVYKNGEIIFSAYCILNSRDLFWRSQISTSLPLLNSNILEMGQQPVFLIENFSAGIELQGNYFYSYGEWLKESHIKFWKETLGSVISEKSLYCAPQFYVPSRIPVDTEVTLEKLINSLNFLALRDNRSSYRYPFANAIWSSWFGGYDFLNKIDWTPLAKRDVYFFQIGNELKEAIKHYLEIWNIFDTCLGTFRLKLVHLPEKKDNINLENNSFSFLEENEVFMQAINAGLELKEKQASGLANYLREHQPLPHNQSKYIVDPVIKRKSFCIISGRAGVGKSYFAIGLGAAMAAGGRLFYDWNIRQKANVVYVTDDEMDDDIIQERLNMVARMYPGCLDNFRIHPVHRINLLTEKEQKALQAQIDPLFLKGTPTRPHILILDHLWKLTDTEGAQTEKWPIFRSWIEDLNNANITVLLLHHEYSDAKVYGTGKIIADADVHIHISRGKKETVKDVIGMLFSVPKNKSAKDQLKELEIQLDFRHTPRWREISQDTEEKFPVWNSLSIEEKIEKVKELRKLMSMQEIANGFQISKSNLEKFCFNNELSEHRNTHPKKNSSAQSE